MKRVKAFSLTIISLHCFLVNNLFAQNSYPTAKNTYMTLDGGGINLLPPLTTGGWARGLSFYNTENTERSFELGVYGIGTETKRLYIGYSQDAPWSTANGIHLLPTGFVGIGTASPKARLSVDGNILATEVKVKTDIDVPDYVFDPDYKLPSLSEIEAYVKSNRHLPEVPSATDIKRDGLDLAEMNLLLLKKVEELTLHLIEKEKKEHEMYQLMNAMERRLSQLENPK